MLSDSQLKKVPPVMKIPLISIVTLCVISATAWSSPTYDMTLLPAPPGAQWLGTFYSPVINNSHQIALTYLTDNYTWQPYLWSNSNFTPLALPAAFTSGGTTAINNAGTVVGYAGDPLQGPNSPVAWNNATPTFLDQQGQPYGIALSINDNGVIGGMIGNGANGLTVFGRSASSFPVLWNGATTTTLGQYGAEQAAVIALNNSGQALVDTFHPATFSFATYLVDNGVTTPIGPLGDNQITGSSLNDAGQILVEARAEDEDGFVATWDNGTFTQLSIDPTQVFAPAAINNNGDILGNSGLWQNGQFYDVNTLIPNTQGGQYLTFTDIADDGTIVGYGTFDGEPQAFILTPSTASSSLPTPDPTTLPLLLPTALPPLRRHPRKAPSA